MGFRDHWHLSHKALLFSLLFSCVQLSGCGTLDSGRRWGEDVTLNPGWDTIGRSARDALTSPMFYLPAAAALLLQIDHADRRISDWAREHTPVYGSEKKAQQRSKDIRSAASYTLYLTMLATPGGREPVAWGISKAKGALVQQSAAAANHYAIDTYQNAIGRQRPDDSDDRSFPSRMAGDMAAFTALSSRNVEAMNIPGAAKTTLNGILYAALSAGAWARVESGSHYPADVLAAISHGYFLSSFINDSFMGLNRKNSGMPVVGFGTDNISVGYCWMF